MRVQMDADVRASGEGDAWQVFVNLTTRPFGWQSPLYGGMGPGVSKRTEIPHALGRESLAAHHSIIVGFSANFAGARPFAEALLLDPMQPSRTAIGVRLRTRLLLGR
jgi:hypothetical protein